MPLKQKKPKVFADKMIILVSKKWQISPQKSKSNLRQIRPSRVILLKKAFLREIKSLIKTDLNNPAPRLRNRSESILKSTKIYYFQKILTFFFFFSFQFTSRFWWLQQSRFQWIYCLTLCCTQWTPVCYLFIIKYTIFHNYYRTVPSCCLFSASSLLGPQCSLRGSVMLVTADDVSLSITPAREPVLMK